MPYWIFAKCSRVMGLKTVFTNTMQALISHATDWPLLTIVNAVVLYIDWFYKGYLFTSLIMAVYIFLLFWFQLRSVYMYFKSTFGFVMHVQSILGTLRCLVKTMYELYCIENCAWRSAKQQKGIYRDLMLYRMISVLDLCPHRFYCVDRRKKNQHCALKNTILCNLNWIFKIEWYYRYM